MFFVTAMYERSTSLSTESMVLSEKSKPRLPLIGTTLLSITTALSLTFFQIFCSESMSLSKFSCIDSPGATFGLQTMKAECSTS